MFFAVQDVALLALLGSRRYYRQGHPREPKGPFFLRNIAPLRVPLRDV